MAEYDFRIASGHNVAYSSLVNIEDITQIGRPPSLPKSPNLFPVRKKSLSGLVRGYGKPGLVWTFDSLPMTALDYIIDTYLVTSGSEVASKAVTIFTRLSERGGYRRYNAYLEYPNPESDYTEDGGYALDLKLRFTQLVQV